MRKDYVPRFGRGLDFERGLVFAPVKLIMEILRYVSIAVFVK